MVRKTYCQLDATELQVRLTEKRSSFLQFVTSACAIIGGVFTISGIVDAFVYHGQQVRFRAWAPC